MSMPFYIFTSYFKIVLREYYFHMKQLVYRLIFHPKINYILRNVNRTLAPVLPGWLKISPSGLMEIKLSGGKKMKFLTNQTSYLTKLIFWDGYENFEYTDLFNKLIRKVSVFYDVGANIGYYSLIAALENEDIEVVSFEPATGPLHFLKMNVALNNLTNVRIEPIALSDKKGEIVFYEIRNKKYKYLEYNLAGEGNAGSKTTGRNFVPSTVKTMTLDQYVKMKGDKTIDLIKMDTEGTENTILSKSDEVLKHMRPIVICETLFDTIEPELDALFRKYGYEFYNHVDDHLEKVETIVRKIDDGVRNCFFVPPEKFNLISEFVKV